MVIIDQGFPRVKLSKKYRFVQLLVEIAATNSPDCHSKVVRWGSLPGDGSVAVLFQTVQQTKRFFKILAGFTLLVFGIIMLVAPGPGWVTIVLGLALLAAEFVWARRLLNRLKTEGMRLRDTLLPASSRKT